MIKNSVLETSACVTGVEISPAQPTEKQGWVEHADKTTSAGLWTFEGFGLQNNINYKSSTATARPCTHLSWKGRGCQ